MWSTVKEYWGTAVFWLIAAGFAVSDIHSLTLQFLFWGAGLVFLVPGLRKELNKIAVIPSHLNPAPATTSVDRIAKGIFISMVVMLLGSWLSFAYFWLRPTPHPVHDAPLRQVHNAKFSNEVVKVDGHEFYDCSFENVTFHYDGTTHFKIIKPKVSGITKIRTSSFETQHMMQFLGALGALKNGYETSGPEK